MEFDSNTGLEVTRAVIINLLRDILIGSTFEGTSEVTNERIAVKAGVEDFKPRIYSRLFGKLPDI